MIVDTFLIVLLFSLFAFTHSFLASNKIKERLIKNIGEKIAFYRLFYNLTSIILFLAFLFLAPKPDVIIYDLHYPFDIITFVLQIISFIGLLWSLKGTDLKEFSGIAQLMRYIKGEYKLDDGDAIYNFRVEGAYKFVRHPVYLFSILFLGFRPIMDLFYFVTFICVVIYFYIGSLFEEKKLVQKFGMMYSEYQKRVPRLIPYKIFINKWSNR
ncbi:methyltransferase family protein [Rosettibacter firmus]|uniref:methyltransferase family protein n=1 Tax=Rosettibacter firmus TaxID=3111522 RepID=UPI00336C02F8